MTQTLAAVRFSDSKPYHFSCDIQTLVKGDTVTVEALGSNKQATFLGYTDPDMVGFLPNKKVLGKVDLTKQISAVRNSGSKRTQLQIEQDTIKLFNFLEENRPTALTSTEIGKFMGWSDKASSSNIKTSMRKNGKIINYDHNLYTVRRSEQDKYKMMMEVN